MEKFSQIDGLAAPLMRANIDTDIITPGKRIATTERDKMGEIAFEPLRFNPDGSENPDFVLNQDRYRGAEVLVTGPNFGCGSSRETAVWALRGLVSAVSSAKASAIFSITTVFKTRFCRCACRPRRWPNWPANWAPTGTI